MRLETQLFRTLNPLVEPWVRAGFFSPWIWPTGMVVLETEGRRTGRPHRVPVLGTMIQDHLVVGTLRGERSQWFRNLRSAGRARYWLRGEPRSAHALTFAPNAERPDVRQLPPGVRAAVARLAPAVGMLGWRFAVLSPGSLRGDRRPLSA